MKEMHARANVMADAKRQLREAHRERDRLRTVEMVRTLRDDEAVHTKQVSTRGLSARSATDAFGRPKEKGTTASLTAPGRARSRSLGRSDAEIVCDILRRVWGEWHGLDLLQSINIWKFE